MCEREREREREREQTHSPNALQHDGPTHSRVQRRSKLSPPRNGGVLRPCAPGKQASNERERERERERVCRNRVVNRWRTDEQKAADVDVRRESELSQNDVFRAAREQRRSDGDRTKTVCNMFGDDAHYGPDGREHSGYVGNGIEGTHTRARTHTHTHTARYQ